MTQASEWRLLRQAAIALELPVSDEQLLRLLAYRDLIVKWNKVYNLTALRDPSQMLSHHLVDSLAAVPPLQNLLALRRQTAPVREDLSQTPQTFNKLRVNEENGRQSRMSATEQRKSAVRLLDVGSGAGLPGVVFGICLPQVQVTCVDAVGKKAAFVQQVAGELRLLNLRGLHARVEQIPVSDPAQRFDIITSRAFASLADFVQLTRHLRAEHGVWMALKAKLPEEEIALLPDDVRVLQTQPLHVPGLEAQRCIVWLEQQV